MKWSLGCRTDKRVKLPTWIGILESARTVLTRVDMEANSRKKRIRAEQVVNGGLLLLRLTWTHTRLEGTLRAVEGGDGGGQGSEQLGGPRHRDHAGIRI